MSPNKPNSNKQHQPLISKHQQLVGKPQPTLETERGHQGWKAVTAAIQGDVSGGEGPALASAPSPHRPLGEMPKYGGAS